MFKYAPEYAWLQRLDDKGEVRRHLLAHTLKSRVVVWHDCELCTAGNVDLSSHPDAIFRNVYAECHRVDKKDLEGLPDGWDPQIRRNFGK